MKAACVGRAIFLALASMPGVTDAVPGAPAPNFSYQYPGSADIITNSVLVPSAPTIDTYYEAIGWNFNLDGAGYTGIQFTGKPAPTGTPTFIFSMWDPISSKSPISVDYLDAGAATGPFGNEGTGVVSINWSLGWLPDRWYALVVRRWDCYAAKTCVGLWINKQAEGKWVHHITMVYPVAGIRFGGWMTSFLEDWAWNGKYRSVRYRNAWARTAAGWQPLGIAGLGASEGGPTDPILKNAYRGFVDGDAFGLEAGTGVKTDKPVGTYFTVAVGASHGFPPPVVSGLTATVAADNSAVQLSWTVDEAKSPQIGYTARLVRLSDGGEVSRTSSTLPQARSATLAIPARGKYRVELQVTDIFDQSSAVASQSF